ncbi:MAG TPA: dihydrolipoyllysine-residue acetyltransferase [Candidatus Rubrimentiphilum sp.]|nr:dihydrolipoyllysine-residue acetyltransferase [Candidatus Rubrimentiphilum sp.]
MTELKVPDIGDFKDIPVIEVLVKPGDTVKKNDSLITLESEKAAMEVPATEGGVVKELRIKVGDKVSKGSVIATIEPEQAAAPAAAPQKPKEATPSPNGGQRAPESAPKSEGTAKQAERKEAAPQPQAAPTVEKRTEVAPSPSPPLRTGSNGATHASPSTRRFARELGVDLHRVQPSGPNGRVTREDVQNFVKRSLRADPSTLFRTGSASDGGLRIAPWPKIDFAQYGEIERKPLSRIQKISGPVLHRNWVSIPHVTQNDDADVTDLEEFRKELNADLKKRDIKVTMLAFLIKASVAALKRFPDFNSSLDGDQLVLKKYYNIGFAADTPDGLLVPVIRGADRKGIAELAEESAALAAKARDGKLTNEQIQGGTFTISSLGSIGGTYFTPIINAPEVAILGACRAAMRPVWDGEQFVPRLIQPLSLSYDHRVIDGASAARFTAYLATVLADLRRALV